MDNQTKYRKAVSFNFADSYIVNQLYYNSEKLALYEQDVVIASYRDIDVYKLSIAANSILDLTIQKADDLSFIDFELRNSNGDLISGGELFGANPEEKRIGIGDEGDYFLSIKQLPYSGGH